MTQPTLFDNFYNTTKESGEVLHQSKNQAVKQDLIILDYFKRNGTISASQIHKSDIMNGAPITSIRRAINTLFKTGLIERVGKVTGIYGKSEYTYKINKI